MKNIFYIPIVLSCLILAGCNTEDELKTDIIKDYTTDFARAEPGSADFSNYVSIGASFTAGYMDGALYDAGQTNSYPAIIAAQMGLPGGGGGSFNQPDINSADGYNTVVSDPAAGVILGRFVVDAAAGAPVPIGPGDLTSILTPHTGDLNNYGVPGARVVDLLSPLYGTPDIDGDMIPEGNPFYVRFASAPGTSTILGDAAAAGASFFSIQIGGNDALGWALSGGTGLDAAVAGAGSLASGSTLTDGPTFAASIAGVVATMRTGGAKGVISNIGDLTLLPMFSLVPFAAIPMTDQATVDALNTGFAGFNAAIDGLVGNGLITAEDGAQRKVSYALGANPTLIEDDNLNDLSDEFDILQGAGAITAAERAALQPFVIARPIKSTEITLVTAQTVIGTEVAPNVVRGVSFPLGDQYTLTDDELATLRARIDMFNDAIEAQVVAGEVGLVDLEAFSAATVANGGYSEGGLTIGLSITPNDLFSADFIHPNPRGMALFANQYIKAINSTFGASVPEADVFSFPGASLL